MKQRPILFATDMVQAILADEKTQTRRVKGLKLINENPDHWQCFELEQDPDLVPHDGDLNDVKTHKGLFAHFEHNGMDETWPGFDFTAIKCPYGQPGDLLYVKETYCPAASYGPHSTRPRLYKADLQDDRLEQFKHWGNKWTPSIHMPKAAARIWLQITEVRVERLQDITEQDATAEGALSRYEFAQLWQRINGRQSWGANPWVWAIHFKLLSSVGYPQYPPFTPANHQSQTTKSITS